MTLPPEPSPPAETTAVPDGPQGLGGWLILVGLGVVVTPLRILAQLAAVHLPLWGSDEWKLLTAPGSEFYRPGVAPLVYGEVVVNLLLAAAAVYTAVLFFKKSRHFPRWFVILLLASPAVVIGDALATAAVFPEEQALDADTSKEVGRSVLALLIWIPYIAQSKRVKNTFTS